MSRGTEGGPRRAGWFTSSYTNNGGACVQVRFDDAAVLLADSKNRGRGPVITLSGSEWDDFVASALGAPPAAVTITPITGGGRAVTAKDGTTLTYTAAEWNAFLAGAADGEFHRPAVATSQSPA